jgi:tetratricopeptide (TPR) repeat protein
MKRYNNARTAFRTATQKDPSLVEAWLKLGEIEAASGGSSGVVAAYKNAYRNVPGNAALYEKFLGAAILYHEEDDAIAFLEELSGKPGHQHRRLDVAYLHYMNGDIDKSASIAGAISPEKASARTNLLRAVFNSFSGSMMKSGTKPAK